MPMTFEALMTEFCQATGICDNADIEAIIGGAPLDIDGVAVSIRHAAGIAPDRLSIYCDFGVPPQAQRAKVYSRILEMNLAGYELDLGVFGTSPDSGCIILATRFSLGTMTVAALREVLAHLVERGEAFEWSYCRTEAGSALVRRGLATVAIFPRR